MGCIPTGDNSTPNYPFYIPNKNLLGGPKSKLPLLKGKQSVDTKIYVCMNKTCHLPVTTLDEALQLMN